MSEEFDIEELLRTHLLDDQEIPPAGLFDQIDAQLSEKRNKKRFFWWFWIGLGSFTLLAAVGVNNYFNQTIDFPLASKCTLDYTHQTNPISVVAENESSSSDLITQRQLSESTYAESATYRNPNEPINFGSKSGSKSKVDDRISIVEMGTRVKKSDSLAVKVNLGGLTVDEIDSVKSEQLANQEAITNNQKSDSTRIKDAADTTSTTDNTAPSNDSIPDPSQQGPPDEKSNSSKFGLLVYGGPLLFDIAVFKPYFSSGALSNVSFPSSSYEIGIGIYHQIKDRFYVQMNANYNVLQSQFAYDLLISESDFFEHYELDKQIPLANLDDPEVCNCFLVEDVSLNYKITNFAFTVGTGYQLIQRPKFNFGPEFSFSAVLSSKFMKKQDEIVLFPIDQVERFTSSRLQLGLGFHYAISDRLQLGLTPSYGIQFNNNSTVYAKNLSRILIPLSFKVGF